MRRWGALLVLLLAALPAHAQTLFGPALADSVPAAGQVQEIGARAVAVPPLPLGGKCKSCTQLSAEGLAVVLTIRSTPPHRDLAAFRRAIGQMLDGTRPALLVLEGLGDGSEAETHELAAACLMAHARGIKCAPGPLPAEGVAAAAWTHFMRKGQAAHACAFARRAFTGGEQMCRLKKAEQAPPARLLRGQRTERLLALYRRAAVDFVNFTWAGADEDSLATAAEYLRRASGKALASTALSLAGIEAEPNTLAAMMEASERLNLGYALWALPLLDSMGEPTPLGAAFAEYLDKGEVDE